LRFPANHNWVTWLCPVLLLAVPVFDMTHVCVARLRRGQNPFSTPGKDHTSHLLARMGLERRWAVLAIHAAVILCGVVAGVVAYASTVLAYAVAGGVLAFAVFLLLYFELRFGRGGTEEG
jgi:UDP-GlcNAc:undecaprenyl-phosphate GlcNAc-1-phosphate transferase